TRATSFRFPEGACRLGGDAFGWLDSFSTAHFSGSSLTFPVHALKSKLWAASTQPLTNQGSICYARKVVLSLQNLYNSLRMAEVIPRRATASAGGADL